MRVFMSVVALALVLASASHCQAVELLDEHGDFTGDYIGPNESAFSLYMYELRNAGGAYIGVGTFRVLNASLLGNFDKIIFFDCDPASSQFNKINLRLIADSKDRFEYLARLFLKSPQSPMVDKARLGQLSEKNFTKWLLEPLFNLNPNSDIDADLVRFFHPDPSAPANTLASLHKFMTYKEMKVELKGAYWGSGMLFRAIQDKIRQGKYQVVTGNLLGPTALKSVGDKLRQLNLHVGAIDISNAMHYLRTIDEFHKMEANLKALPMNEETRILHTVNTIMPISDGDQMSAPLKKSIYSVYYIFHSEYWVYTATSPQALFRAIDDLEIEYNPYASILNRLHKAGEFPVLNKTLPPPRVRLKECHEYLEFANFAVKKERAEREAQLSQF